MIPVIERLVVLVVNLHGEWYKIEIHKQITHWIMLTGWLMSMVVEDNCRWEAAKGKEAWKAPTVLMANDSLTTAHHPRSSLSSIYLRTYFTSKWKRTLAKSGSSHSSLGLFRGLCCQIGSVIFQAFYLATKEENRRLDQLVGSPGKRPPRTIFVSSGYISLMKMFGNRTSLDSNLLSVYRSIVSVVLSTTHDESLLHFVHQVSAFSVPLQVSRDLLQNGWAVLHILPFVAFPISPFPCSLAYPWILKLRGRWYWRVLDRDTGLLRGVIIHCLEWYSKGRGNQVSDVIELMEKILVDMVVIMFFLSPSYIPDVDRILLFRH